jgi:LemA protein
VLLARLFGFKPASLLVFGEAEKADVNLKALFG